MASILRQDAGWAAERSRHRDGPGAGAVGPSQTVACRIVLENLSLESFGKAARGAIYFPGATGDCPRFLTLKIPWRCSANVDAQRAGRDALKDQVARGGVARHRVATDEVEQTAVGR